MYIINVYAKWGLGYTLPKYGLVQDTPSDFK